MGQGVCGIFHILPVVMFGPNIPRCINSNFKTSKFPTQCPKICVQNIWYFISLSLKYALQIKFTEITDYETKLSLTVLLTSGTSTWRLWVEPMPSFSSTAVSIATVLPKKLDLKMIQVKTVSFWHITITYIYIWCVKLSLHFYWFLYYLWFIEGHMYKSYH